MALQNTFLGKRKPDTLGSSSVPSTGPSPLATPAPREGAGARASTAPATPPADAGAVGSQLTVGPNIKLKGVEITDCDTLVVEGTVEATMDSRVIRIAEQGAFRGAADIDIAEIHGEFNGDLTVREKLMIYATGRVTGKIRYGKLVIEEGGQLAGDIQLGGLRPAVPVLQDFSTAA